MDCIQHHGTFEKHCLFESKQDEDSRSETNDRTIDARNVLTEKIPHPSIQRARSTTHKMLTYRVQAILQNDSYIVLKTSLIYMEHFWHFTRKNDRF
jgi:hypothetical protein